MRKTGGRLPADGWLDRVAIFTADVVERVVVIIIVVILLNAVLR